MKHDVLQVLGAALKKVIVTHSAYINGPDVNWDDVAAQVVLQCDGDLAIMSKDVYEALLADSDAWGEETGCGPLMGKEADERIPFTLTEDGSLQGSHGATPSLLMPYRKP